MQISECSISIQSTSHKCWLRRVLDVAQQGETKDDGKNSQNKQIARIFLFFFPKGTSRNQFIFYFFFALLFYFLFFSEQGSQKMEPQKLAPTTEVLCGLQKNNTFSEKRAKPLTIFFLYFPEFFWGF